VAVITTDTYMANPAFSEYLDTVIPGTLGWPSDHIVSRLSTFENPSWNPNLVNLTTGVFDAGVRYGELVPVWGPNFSRLLPGLHDGPIPGLCTEMLPHFLNGATLCSVRDDQTVYNGADECISPSPGEKSTVQCVNTAVNDTVRSGNPIIETM